MPRPREFLFGSWRAVSVLGVTQIITWGVLFYPPVLTMPLIARERGWSLSFAMGGFSLALFVGGMVAPRVGALIDRYGGHVVLPCGSLIAAAGLVALVHAAHWLAYLAVWMLLGVAMAAQLYDAAFATLGRVFGAAARQPITFRRSPAASPRPPDGRRRAFCSIVSAGAERIWFMRRFWCWWSRRCMPCCHARRQWPTRAAAVRRRQRRPSSQPRD
jgi:MFS family permease